MTRRVATALLLTLGGCQKLTDVLSVPPQRLKSPDGALEISVPATWSDDSAPTRKLNPQAVLQASHRAEELYVIVMTEEKAELGDMDLTKFSAVTRASQLQSMAQAVEEGPRQRTINGMPSIEYVLKGAVEKTDVVMKHAAVEGSKRYHQVLVWTLSDRWERQKAGLDAVVDSLKELPGGGSAARAPAP